MEYAIHLELTLVDISDCSLHIAILEMSIDATKHGLLAAVLTSQSLEDIIRKLPIISMVMVDEKAMISCKSLKGNFCIDHFLRRQVADQKY